MSTLNFRRQVILLLGAGINTPRPYSPRALAQTLHISVAHEARIERAALRKLRTAAREGNCGSTPAWVHVPASNQLVLVDPVLANAA